MHRSRRILRRALIVALLTFTLAACTPAETLRFVWAANGDADHAEEAVDVAWCESRHQPNAVSADGSNFGLMQINRVHRQQFEQVTGQPWDAVLDPFWNAVYAHWLWDQQGWEPWRACSPG